MELPGSQHVIVAGDWHLVADEIERFLLPIAALPDDEPEPETVLATVLFTDLVDSTVRAAAVGDRGWRELLERHHTVIRQQLARYRGVEMDTAGDGFFARFDGPARAIRCARAISKAVGEPGLEIRAGLPTGECELLDGKVAGIAVVVGVPVSRTHARAKCSSHKR